MGITHSKVSAISDGADTNKVRPSDWNADHVGSNVSLLLDYSYAGSDYSAQSLSANTYFDVDTNQSFTSNGGLVEFALRGNAQTHKSTAGDSTIIVDILIDSAGTPIRKRIGGALALSANYLNPFQGVGSVYVALSAGSHTFKVQLNPDSTCDLYLRPSATSNDEFLSVQVIQH